MKEIEFSIESDYSWLGKEYLFFIGKHVFPKQSTM